MIGKEILIPNDIECYINGRDTSIGVLDNTTSKMVVYLDSTECSSCEINYLPRYSNISDVNIWTRGKFAIVFIFSPKNKDIEAIRRSISRYQSINALLLLDKSGNFAKLNQNTLINKNLKTFLLDQNNEVVLVGSPLGNEKMWDLYKKEIARLSRE